MTTTTTATTMHPAVVAAVHEESLQTVTCRLQAKLGGLDRVLGAITHRGWIPTHFQSVLCTQTDALTVSFSFPSTDSFNVLKLVKFLEKQVYVLSASLVEEQPTSLHLEDASLLGSVKQRSA